MKITTRLFSTVIVLLLLSFTLGLIVAPSVLGLASIVDIGGTSGADINARYIAANQFQFNDTNILQITVNGTARYITFPNNTGTVVYRNSSDTLTNKVLTSPTLTSPVVSTSALFGSGTTLKVNSGGQPTFLTITYGARVGALALNNSYPITGANLTAPIFSGTATTAGTFTMSAFTAGGTVDGANQAFNNLGAAGNDFGASNTLVATTFSSTVTLASGQAVKVSSGGSPTLFTPTYGASTITWAWNSSVAHTGLKLGGTMNANNQSLSNVLTVLMAGSSGSADGITIRERSGAPEAGQIFLGSSQDTNLYRGAANRLKTDDNLEVAQSLIMAPIGAGTLVDFQLETEWTTGTIINADFASATTMTGAIVDGMVIDFQTNVTPTTTNGARTDLIRLHTPAMTQTSTNTATIQAIDINSAGALIQNTDAGTIYWRGLNIQMPAITQTTGSVNAFGIAITGGAVTTAGTPIGIQVTMNAATQDAIKIYTGQLNMNGNNLVGIPNGSTGAGSAALGSNSPAVTLTAPATWIPVTLANGTTVYIPAFK